MTGPVSIYDNGDGTASVTLIDYTFTPPPDVTVNPDGSIDLPVILRFLNPFDINNTGVGTITVLPAGLALASFLPLLGRGPAGVSPRFASSGIRHEVPADEPLPTPSVIYNVIDPGDPNASPPTGPLLQVEDWVHAGPQGIDGTPVNLGDLGDILYTGGQTVPLPGQSIVYRTPDGATPGFYLEDVKLTDFAVCNAFSPTAAAVGGAAIIPAGQSAIIYLGAQQTNSTLSNWSTTMTHASFSAQGIAI
jgi:hypothetical protein